MTEDEVLRKNLTIYRNEKLIKECVSLKNIFLESEKILKKVNLYVQSNFKEGSPERNGPIGIYFPIVK